MDALMALDTDCRARSTAEAATRSLPPKPTARDTRIRATLHLKLLVGFLIIAVLLLAMGVVSIGVIGAMNHQADQVIQLQRQADLARQGIYAVTAQSHYRAMA